MNPVTGPYARSVMQGLPWGTYRMYRSWYRQREPYNLPLPYFYQCQQVTKVSPTLPHYDGTNSTGTPKAKGVFSNPSIETSVTNQALARFSSKVHGEKAGWLINFVQRKQALDMMSSRLLSLYVFAVRLRQSTVKHAFTALWHGSAKAERNSKRVDRLIAENRLKNGSKHFGNNFLEGHFGWEPLIKDIYASMAILSKDPPPQTILASAQQSGHSFFPRSGYDSIDASVNWKVRVRMGAKIRVVNENILLMEQLGVINPALVLWDSIPWSFLVGWISNVDQYLGAFTDYSGLEIIDSWRSVGYREEREWQWVESGTLIGAGANRSIQVARSLGLPPVTLQLKPLKLSPIKALTAVSLLLQKLK